MIQIIYKLHSGDPAERGIAAKNMSYQSEILHVNEKYFMIPHLLFCNGRQLSGNPTFFYQTLMSIVSQLAIESQEFSDFCKHYQGIWFYWKQLQTKWIVRRLLSYYNSIDKSRWQTPPEGALLDSEYQLKIDEIIKVERTGTCTKQADWYWE